MDYQSYNVTKVEKKIISQHFETFLKDNDVDTDGWSQPEMDFYCLVFEQGWTMARAFTD